MVLPRDAAPPFPSAEVSLGKCTPAGTAQWHWGRSQRPGLLQRWCSGGMTLMAGTLMALGPSARICQCPGTDTPAPGASLVTSWPIPLKITLEDQALPPRQGPSRAMRAPLWAIQDGLGGDIGPVSPLPMPALAVVPGEVAAANTWGGTAPEWAWLRISISPPHSSVHQPALDTAVTTRVSTLPHCPIKAGPR